MKKTSSLEAVGSFVIRFFPVLFILLLWIIFARPYFIEGKVPFPSTYQVNHFQPWSLDQKYWGPVKNGAMPDIIDQIYPWRHFSIQQWSKGSIPWWNPNSFSGNPNIANVQSAAFNPLNILFLFFPFIDAWSLIVLSQSLFAGLGMYFFLRLNGVSRFGAVLGSVSWMFCGFITVWMAYGTLSLAISVLPLALFFLKKFVSEKTVWWGIASAFVISFSFFSGHFQTSLYFFGVVLAYAVFLGVSQKNRVRIFLAFFLLLGITVALVQILPAVQLYGLSPRSVIYLFSGGIPLQYFVTLISPDFFGNPVTRNDWYGFYAEWSSFVGIIPLFFMLLTIGKKNKNQVIFFQALFLLSILFAIDSPLLRVLGFLHIPVLSTSTPSRLIVIGSFAIAVLAGFGYDSFVVTVRDQQLKKLFPAMILILLVIFGIWVTVLFPGFFSAEHAQVAKKNLILPTALFLAMLVVFYLCYLVRKRDKMLFFLLLLPIFFASFDSLRFVSKWMPFDPRADVFPSSKIITEMQSLIGHGRVFGNLGGQVGTYYNLPLIEGYDPLYIDRYGEFIRTSATGKYASSERSVVKIDRNGKYTKRVLDLLDVTLIYHPIPDTNQSWAFPVWGDSKYQLFYHDTLFALYKNSSAIPRPSLFYNYSVIPDSRKLLGTLFTDGFDYRSRLLLEDDPQIPISTDRHTSTIKIIEDSPDRLEFEVLSDAQGLLFLSDNFYPGWRATVNGVSRKIYRADYTFRAVVIPSGKSKVIFGYSGLF